MKNAPRNFTLLFAFLATLLIGIPSFSTKNSGLQEFKIVFESTDDGVKLIGQKGTAFKELSFTIQENVPQGIDEFGMTMKNSKTTDKDENLADFEFTIEKTIKGFVLVGKKGTAWTKLGFDLSHKNKATVDQNGVTVN